jgi:hypothetical protein
MLLKSIDEFKELPLGKKIYVVENYDNSRIDGYYYAGISPISQYIMLICDSDVSKMATMYKDRITSTYITTDYEDAKLQMLKTKIKALERIKKIYFKDWGESEWRNFNINEIINER